MRITVDASVALKWIVRSQSNEQDVAPALRLLKAIGDGDCECFQPSHWRGEVMAVVARKIPTEIDAALVLLHRIPCSIVEDVQILRLAAQQSAQINHHLFDTLYHSVAIEHQACLITADETYFAKARHLGSVQLLSNTVI